MPDGHTATPMRSMRLLEQSAGLRPSGSPARLRRSARTESAKGAVFGQGHGQVQGVWPPMWISKGIGRSSSITCPHQRRG